MTRQLDPEEVLRKATVDVVCIGEAIMEEKNEDQQRFFEDLGATVERDVAEVREVEEDYYALTQGMAVALSDFNQKMQGYVEQNFAAAFKFARELSQAEDMDDFVRIYSEYVQNCFHSFAAQMKDFTETYTKFVTGTIQAPSLSPRE
jgi:tRNA-dihydrouridine synthase